MPNDGQRFLLLSDDRTALVARCYGNNHPLVLCGDDTSANLSCYGEALIDTPAVDRIVREEVRNSATYSLSRRSARRAADGLRDMLSCYGNTVFHTPNTNRRAARR